MNLDEALSQAVEGARVIAPHMQPGCYVEHSFSRGFLRCWPVDVPNEEPNRTQCDFRRHEGDEAADWRILESEEQYPPKPKLTGGWVPLKATPQLHANVAAVGQAVDRIKAAAKAMPPIGDVIDLGALERGTTAPEPARPMAGPWAKPLDPRKGGW